MNQKFKKILAGLISLSLAAGASSFAISAEESGSTPDNTEPPTCTHADDTTPADELCDTCGEAEVGHRNDDADIGHAYADEVGQCSICTAVDSDACVAGQTGKHAFGDATNCTEADCSESETNYDVHTHTFNDSSDGNCDEAGCLEGEDDKIHHLFVDEAKNTPDGKCDTCGAVKCNSDGCGNFDCEEHAEPSPDPDDDNNDDDNAGGNANLPTTPAPPANSWTPSANSESTKTTANSLTDAKTVSAIEKAEDGSKVKAATPKGEETAVGADTLNALKGKDVDLEIKTGNGATVVVNGKSVKADGDVNLTVTYNNAEIPNKLLAAAKKKGSVATLTFGEDGALGLKADLGVKFNDKNAGKQVKLYRYDEEKGKLVLVAKATIGEDGKATFENLSKGGNFVAVIG